MRNKEKVRISKATTKSYFSETLKIGTLCVRLFIY